MGDTEGYMAIEAEIQRRQEQADSVKGKETPFRCVFKTRHGWAYTYHETYKDALNAEFTSCGYGITGMAWTQSARKSRIEKQGPRGGWKKYTEEKQ